MVRKARAPIRASYHPLSARPMSVLETCPVPLEELLAELEASRP
jgi:hypothetical protein